VLLLQVDDCLEDVGVAVIPKIVESFSDASLEVFGVLAVRDLVAGMGSRARAQSKSMLEQAISREQSRARARNEVIKRSKEQQNFTQGAALSEHAL